MTKYVVAAFYQFTDLSDPVHSAGQIRDAARAADVRGTAIVASEGVNGTLAGSREGIDAVMSALRSLPGCAGLTWKESIASAPPFPRLKVKVKEEIVTMGREDARPSERVGAYVAPKDWNALIARDDIALIDTRNDYEVAIGTFPGAINPETESFREFPEWWAANKAAYEGRPVAMFCTGGIRCEKATSFLLGEGVSEVYHLEGGILKYLEDVDAEDSTWDGACFVFDKRVSVEQGLSEGPHSLCHACGRPVSPDDRASSEYERGVQCPACVGDYSDEQRDRFRMRQQQYDKAGDRATGGQ